MKFLVRASWRLEILKLFLSIHLLRFLSTTAVKNSDSAEQTLLALAQQLLSSHSIRGACNSTVLIYPQNYSLLDFTDRYKTVDSAVVVLNSLDTLETVTFVLRYEIQCSIVLYPHSLQEKTATDRNWLRNIPGGIFRSFHFIAVTDQAVQNFCWQCPFIRRLHNVLVFPASESNEFGPVLTPNRFNGDPGFYHVGKVMKNQIILEHRLARRHGPFWNKWADLNGTSVFIGAIPTPESRELANSSFKDLNHKATQEQETASYLNGTLSIKFIPLTLRFGAQLPNGSWDGFVGNIMEDNVQLTLAMFPVVNQYQVVLFSKPFLFSWTTFLTPLPQVKTKTFAFLIEPFDQFVWAGTLTCSILLPLVVLALQSAHEHSFSTAGLILKLVENIGAFAQVLLEQSLPERWEKAVSRLRAVRWSLLALWLLASIVLCNLYKSVVVSVLIRPELEQPPLTFPELQTTNFHINIIMLKSLTTGFKPWLEAYNRSYTDFDVDVKGCVMSILQGRRVCIFLFHSLYEVAGSELLDVSGKRLFLFSTQDLFHFGSCYPISQRNPQLKSRIDSWVNVMVEGGLRPYWMKKALYFKGLKNIHSKRIQNVASGKPKQVIVLDRNMFWYPLLLGCGGLLGSTFVLFVELALFHREKFTQRRPVRSETLVVEWIE